MILWAIFFITLLFYLFFNYLNWNNDFWTKRNVFQLKPIPFFGNFARVILGKVHMGMLLKEIYETGKEPFIGIYMLRQPCLLIRDEEIAKNILTTQFDKFPNHTLHCSKYDELSRNILVCMKSKGWKTLRSKLTPFFSSGKLRNLTGMFKKNADNLITFLENKHQDDSFSIKETVAKYTTDLISMSAFGVEANCLLNDDAEFRKVGRLFFEQNFFASLRFTMYVSMPEVVDFFKISLLEPSACNFLRDVFNHSLEMRKNDGTVKNDLIDLILKLLADREFCEKEEFKGDKIIAQAIVFFVAGFETSSGSLTFALYELAMNPQVQEIARKEIKETQGNLDYEFVQNLPYLDMVISETLRKYPSLPFLDRECESNYKIPNCDLTIEKGMRVLISTIAFHYDEKFYPNPHRFDPDRFKNKDQMLKVPYYPFGKGPRACIGERYALLSMKFALAKILTNFEIVPTDKTPSEIVFNPTCPTLAPKYNLNLKFNKIESN